MAKSNLDYMIENYVSRKMEQVEKDLDSAIRSTNNIMYKEASDMYDSFIYQYYLYETTSYIRHWEGIPGTKQGQNLYFGKDIRKNNGHKPTLGIYLPKNAGYVNKMDGGYQYESDPSNVLQNVLNGFRGVPGKWTIPWYGSYEGKYFSFKGTMEHAFDTFNSHFNDIAMVVLSMEMRNLGYR